VGKEEYTEVTTGSRDLQALVAEHDAWLNKGKGKKKK